ncbi:LysR family transcriptional regulator [Pseudoalteromonas sp. SMS1]|uniref:LysR family transcriptional regulator n=1 Tax=Pseudoalteromonas sp. SMS1 TaxID=2908894 RepID=UPI001F1F1E56|nr:LysR family transcriptional regulator [Pseudoalteromonas sp. SMS1]MCF2855904.1 LysR family transcriptional regulator [Pseudoalteromonas sp. SMS1]
MRLKTTLEQWQTLQAIEEAGSIQAAAITLNKSHTTLIYSVKKLEDQLSIKLIEVKGRKARLTEYGQTMLRRAQSMLDQARELEVISEQLNSGVESQITVAIDHLCDPTWLYNPLGKFLAKNSTTSVQVVETSLSKTTEMVVNEIADIAIINVPITNFSAEAFGVTTMLPVIAADHPLALRESVSIGDFATISQIVVRDLGELDGLKKNVGWLRAHQRVTVDNFDHAFRAVEQGAGFCRLPKHLIQQRQSKKIKVINLEYSNQYQVGLHLTLPKAAKSGLATRALYQTLLASAASRQLGI